MDVMTISMKRKVDAADGTSYGLISFDEVIDHSKRALAAKHVSAGKYTSSV
jgi:hypothetical protein